jgi:hypothetical protein
VAVKTISMILCAAYPRTGRARLLGQVTRGRYSAVELNDGYQLQIANGRQLHPLRRYSGGEQDLAGLRLALFAHPCAAAGSRNRVRVARPRCSAARTPTRRRALVEQLHAHR